MPAFGFSLEEAGVMKTAKVLDIAWEQKYNEYEGALYVAYLVLAGMLKAEENRADDVVEKIDYIQNDWVSKSLVRRELISRFSSKVKERTYGKQQESIPAFEFAPNMPDITRSEPISAHKTDRYLMLLVQDVPSIGERLPGSEKIPLRFLYAMAVVDVTTNNPCMFVTLETGFTSKIFLCVFEVSGIHSNLGDGSSYTERHAFETAAIDIICDALNIDKNTVSKATG